MIRELMAKEGQALLPGEVLECHLNPETQADWGSMVVVEVRQFVRCWAHIAPEITEARRTGRFVGVVHEEGVALYGVG